MNTFTKTLAAAGIAVAALAGTVSVASLAAHASEPAGKSQLLAVANEPAPKLTVDAPVAGASADDVSPRVGHLHITVDNLPWHWAEFSNDGTIVVAELPAGQHSVKIELASPSHHVYTGQTVTFTVPAVS